MYPSVAYAQDTVDSLGGTTDSSNSAVEGTVEGGKNVLDNIKETVRDAQPDETLKKLNGILDQNKSQTMDKAIDISSPLISGLALVGNIIWVSVGALYFVQTAVDVLRIVVKPSIGEEGQQGSMGGFGGYGGGMGAVGGYGGMGGMGGHMGGQQPQKATGKLKGFLKQFFSPSVDCIQAITEATGGQQSGGYGGYGGYGGGVQVSRPHAFSVYLKKRSWTLFLLGITIALFATSLATDLQGDLVGIVIALAKSFYTFVTGRSI